MLAVPGLPVSSPTTGSSDSFAAADANGRESRASGEVRAGSGGIIAGEELLPMKSSNRVSRYIGLG